MVKVPKEEYFMLKHLYLVNLRLFDGEGDTPAGIDGQGAANDSQPTVDEVVVYGKGEVQDNTHAATEKAPVIPGATLTPEERAANFKKFMDDYKEEYTDHFNRHVSNRFKDYKALETKSIQLEPIVNTFMKYYDVETVEELSKIIDDDILSEIAAKEGFTDVEKYKKAKDDAQKAELFDKAKADDETAKQTQTKVNDWLKQGEVLKATLAKDGIEFNFHQETSNPEFLKRLDMGNSVEDAYYLVHRNDIIKNASATAAKNAEKNVVQDIQSNGLRVKENGTKPSPGVTRKSDPSKFTEEDFIRIEQEVARGAKIRL